jgi:hypothetical protein
MKPGVAQRLGPERKQRFLVLTNCTAGETAASRRAYEVAVQPFSDAAIEGAGFSLGARQTPIKFCDPRPLVKERTPVLGGPDVIRRQHMHNLWMARGGIGWHRLPAGVACVTPTTALIFSRFFYTAERRTIV